MLQPPRHILIAVVLAIAPSAAAAQAVRGRVLEAGTDTPLASVVVGLHDARGKRVASTVSDSLGVFEMRAPRSGSYVLRAAAIGHAATQTEPIQLDMSETVVVELRLGIEAVPLAPLVVLQQLRAAALPLQNYRKRMSHNRLLGLGNFITREDIDRLEVSRVSQLFYQVPRVHLIATGLGRSTLVMNGRGGNCQPAFFVDGTKLRRTGEPIDIDSYVSAADVEGIEIYRGISETPAEFYDPDERCGAIVIWTRRHEDDLPVSLAKGQLIALGLSLVFLLIQYTAY